jgi:hypothetical protein
LRTPDTASNEPAWDSSGTPSSRRFAKSITAKPALCQVSNDLRQAEDHARSRPFLSARESAGCRDAGERHRLSLTESTNPLPLGGAKGSPELAYVSFLSSIRPPHELPDAHTWSTPETAAQLHLLLPYASFSHLLPLYASRRVGGSGQGPMRRKDLRTGNCHFILQPTVTLRFKLHNAP